MINLNEISHIVSLAPEFEHKILKYVKQNINNEIFVGLIGQIRGKGKTIIEFRISDGLPFPNLSQNKQKNIKIVDHWLQIVKEYVIFQKGKQKNALRILGVIHSHPGSMPALSSIDEEFGYQIAQELGNALMLVVGKKMTLYAYLIEDHQITQIKHNSKKFKKKYSLTPTK